MVCIEVCLPDRADPQIIERSTEPIRVTHSLIPNVIRPLRTAANLQLKENHQELPEHQP